MYRFLESHRALLHFCALCACDTRLAILIELTGGERSVNAIAAAIGGSQPRVSKHLDVLSRAGLVTKRKLRNQRIYRLNPERLFRSVRNLGALFNSPALEERR